MSVITTTDALLSTAIYSALSTALTNAGYSGAGPYYRLAPQGTALPYGVFQYQTITGVFHVGDQPSEADVLIKALAASPSVARTMLATMAAAMPNLAIANYSLSVQYQSSPTLPIDGNVWQVAHIYNIRLEAN